MRRKARHEQSPAKATGASAIRSPDVIMGEDFSGEMRLQLEQLVDRLVVKGDMARHVIEIMLRELEDTKAAYEQDPDPAKIPPRSKSQPTTGRVRRHRGSRRQRHHLGDIRHRPQPDRTAGIQEEADCVPGCRATKGGSPTAQVRLQLPRLFHDLF
ncbi:hypothetical protein [Ciceribacter sp. T2.26MG-112.2]|uniref:hypothetical protein n=1 Tax=Ciceribacter sp. T2.26MG-112.2 TaxID=3137154 RepID=UPI001E62C4E4|nr:hypothetical protein [Ciceribacter naphthalenivorans]